MKAAGEIRRLFLSLLQTEPIAKTEMKLRIPATEKVYQILYKNSVPSIREL